MAIESTFDVEFVSRLALREKQIQQIYRPIIAVHKWFARRPGTLFRALILSEFVEGVLSEIYYSGHDLSDHVIADPFMGGGTPLIEANRLGCGVIGIDINPMSRWIVQREIEHLDVPKYRAAASSLVAALDKNVGSLYRTRCTICGSLDARAKYFLSVNVQQCAHCGEEIALFPGYLIAENVRHPKNVLLCRHCGTLSEVESLKAVGKCSQCRKPLSVNGPASRNRCRCSSCGEENRYPDPKGGPPRFRMFAIEYHCLKCRPSHKGRFFKTPDSEDLQRYADAEGRIAGMTLSHVPSDEIPPGDESTRLHRWGYLRYRDTFNARQLLGLELSCALIRNVENERVRNALATNLSDLVRYQNMLCRYDTMALKSLDVFSLHGFPAGLVRCESNLLGIQGESGVNVGSGGWFNIIDKYGKAKEYCDRPFEVIHGSKGKRQVLIAGEWIGDSRPSDTSNRRVELYCRNASEINLKSESLDGVFTDPPYFGSVQYAELMDYCYVWLRKLAGQSVEGFERPSTRDAGELTGNESMERDLTHFAEGLAAVFRNLGRALKPGAPFVFTYHHNEEEAYYPIAMAILDAGLACTASLPCPAEMGASIHINGTGSSVVDTVFVCRSTGKVPRTWVAASSAEVAGLVSLDVARLAAAGVKVTPGDIRCMVYGHLARLSVWKLRPSWQSEADTPSKMDQIAKCMSGFGGLEGILQHLESDQGEPVFSQADLFRESRAAYEVGADAIAF